MKVEVRKIGYDAKRIVKNGTGLGSYGRTLINALVQADQAMELRLYAPDRGREELRNQVNESQWTRFCYPERVHTGLQKILWRNRGIVKQLKKDGVCLFHGLSGELPSGLKKAGIPGVVTIHDLIFLRHPEFYHWIDTKIYAAKFRQTCREAERIIAISQCTKRDIMAFSDFPEERIDVIYQSCNTIFREPVPKEKTAEIRRKYALPPRYILHVGTIEERKNILLAVKALRLLPEDIHLVVIGREKKYTGKVRTFVADQALDRRVMFLHGVPNTDLPAIYRRAKAFAYPSRYEGFGLPIVEAIQSGLPVVACTGSCLEEAGGPDCLYVHPDDVRGMATALERAIYDNDFRRLSLERSKEYIKRFENTDAARQVIEVYEKTL